VIRLACASFALLALAGCAIETIAAGEPRAITDFPIAPYEIHEECVRLAFAQRLDYRFTAQRPVTFEITYQDGSMFVSPVTRENVAAHSGIYRSPATRRYCLRWEAGREGALLTFHARLLPAESLP
jgi:hypothetical protein